jgi:hypothetical protein
MVRASDCQCTSCNGPGFDPGIHRHRGIKGAADEAVLNIVLKKSEIPPKLIPVPLFEQQMEKEENKDVQPIDKKVLKLPEASFKEIPNYTISRAPPLPEKYFDFVEKSQEELDKVSYRYTHKTSGL